MQTQKQNNRTLFLGTFAIAAVGIAFTVGGSAYTHWAKERGIEQKRQVAFCNMKAEDKQCQRLLLVSPLPFFQAKR
jgi:hypothetical protein